MAGQESLGRAILYLDVDDTALRNGVRNARQYVNQQLGRSGGGGQARGGGGRTPEDRRAATMVITRNLGERLNRLEERGRNVAQQRAALSRAAAATDKGRLETARSLNKLVREYVVQEERGLRASSRAGRQLADPIDARFQAQKRRYALDQQIRALETAGVRSDTLRARLGEVTTAQAQRRFGLARQLSDQLSFDLRKERDKLRVQQQQQREIAKAAKAGGPSSPIQGRKDIFGSPAYFREVARENQRAEREAGRARTRRRARIAGRIGEGISSGLIGGAFPLLFGQGAGAAAGGLAGGALGALFGGQGGGFAGSLVGTTLGQAFDVAIQKASALASALESPIQNFEAVAAAGLLSSTALEKQIRALLDTGRTAEAAALLQEDLANKQSDIESTKKLQAATKDLSNQWNQFSINLAAVAAGPLADVIAAVNKLLGASAARTDFSNLDQEIAVAVEAARRGVQAERRNEISQRTDVGILSAELSNNKLLTIELKKQKLELDRINETSGFNVNIAADRIRLEAINLNYKKEELRLENQFQKELQRRQLLQQQVQNAQGAFGRSPATEVGLQAAANIQAQINEFGPASLEVQLALQEGANSILEALKNGATQLRDSVRELRDLRLNNLRFLPARQREELIRQQKNAGLPEAQSRGVALRSLEDLFSFNRFIEQEQSAMQGVVDAERNLAQANDSLRSEIITQTGALQQLTGVMGNLVDKSWSVYVQVPGQNVATAINLQAQLGS